MSFLSAAGTVLTLIPTAINAVRALTPLKKQIKQAEILHPTDSTASEKVKSYNNKKKHNLVWNLVRSYLLEPFIDAGLTEAKIKTLFSAFVILTKEFKKVVQGFKNVVKQFRGKR